MAITYTWTIPTLERLKPDPEPNQEQQQQESA